MSTKRLLSLSKNVKSLVLLRQPNVIHHFCRFASATDKVKQLSKKSFKDDLACNEFNTTKIPSKVQCLLESNEQTINGDDIVAAMFSLSKMYHENKLKQNIHEETFFKKLCILITSCLHKLQISEAIEILNILLKIGIPSSSKVISNILRYIDSLLINSSLQYYNKINEIIYKMKPTPSTQAMSKSIKRKFIVKLSTDFDTNDLEFLTEAFIYACRNIRDRRVLKIITSALTNNNFETVTVSNAVKLMKTMISKEKILPEWYQVLHATQHFLINNIDRVTDLHMNSILHGLTYKLEKGRRDKFYNETLLDSFAQKIISIDTGLISGLRCLECFNKFRHVNQRLLDYVNAKYYEEKKMKHKHIPFELEKLFTLLTGFAFLKYKPIFWDEIYKSLRTKRILNYNYETLLIYSLHLSCLDCYDSLVLEKVFNAKNDFSDDYQLLWSFLKLWQKLKTLPYYDGPLPSVKDVKLFKNLRINKTYPLLSTLEQGLGGSMYIKTNLRSKLYHHIDHIVTYRNGEYPVAINGEDNHNTDGEFLEDIKIPSNSQIIAIIRMPPSYYSRNTNQLLGPYSIYVDTLEALSFPTVAICDKEWFKLSENSRVPFLMNHIKSKLNDCKLSMNI